MFGLNKMCVAIFLSLLALVSCKEQALEITGIEKHTVETNPTKNALLSLLKVAKSELQGDVYTYKCSVGTYSSSRLACTFRDNASWPTAQDVNLKLSCPAGSGSTLSYVEIIFAVSSPKVHCFINEGAIDSSYIGITIEAWSTVLFDYFANFYIS